MWPLLKKKITQQNSKVTQMLELADWKFMVLTAIINIFEELKENVAIMSEEVENLGRATETIL